MKRGTAIILLVAISLLIGRGAIAKIQYDTVGGTNCDSSCATITLSFTIGYGSGKGRMVIIGVSSELNPATTVSGVKYNNVAATKINESISNPDVSATARTYMSLWYIGDADLPSGSGSSNIVATFTSTANNAVLKAISLIGVRQGAPEANNYGWGTVTGTGQTVSASITPVSNCAWMVDYASAGDPASASVALTTTGSGQTEKGSDTCASSMCASMSIKQLPTAAFSMGWDQGTDIASRFGVTGASFACRRSFLAD